MMSEQSKQRNCPTSTSYVQDFLVSLFQLQEKDAALKIPEAQCFLKSHGFSKTSDPDILYSKTLKAYLITTVEKLSKQYLKFSPTLGWQLLNSKFFGVPQNRERVYIVGHYGEKCSRKIFPLTPNGIENISTLNKHPLSPKTPQGNRIYLPDGLSSCLTANGGGLGAKTGLYFVNRVRYDKYCPSDTVQTLLVAGDTPLMRVRNGTKKGYDEAIPGDGINLAFPQSKTRRGRVGKGCSQTLDTNCNMGTIDGYRIRRLTPLECFRLQGFPDEMIEKAREIGLADCRLYKMAGNAVTVNVVEAVARKIAEVENGRT